MCLLVVVFFFFQAEDGIRDKLVTGVQTCALPIWCFCSFGGKRSYSAPARWLGSAPSGWRSSSRIWYSNPSAAWLGACAMESSSDTLYLTPLFAPGVTFHSQLNSKSPNVSSVIRSPPWAGCPSGSLGTLPLAIFLIAPSTTTQWAVGTVS